MPDQDNFSDALKRSIPGQTPMPGVKTGHTEEVEGLMQVGDQKDDNATPEESLKE